MQFQSCLFLCSFNRHALSPLVGLSGGYDVRLPENVEYLEELKAVAASEGISDCVHFLTSISDEQKTSLLRGALAVLYTPQVS